jgi:hypothetical protein
MPLLFCALLAATPPEPPRDLAPWVDWARRLVDTGPACPPERGCLQLSELALRGRVTSGSIVLSVSGENLGRLEQSTMLLRPAATFSVTAVRWSRGRGWVRLAGDAWQLTTEPGPFALEADVRFTPTDSLPLELASGVGHVVDRLEQGSLAFDESSERHGGAVYLTSEARREARDAEPISVRVVRELRWGSVVTFTYHYEITGLREQSRVELPLLGGETVEGLDPDIAYTVSPGAIAVTLTPGPASLSASGHFAAAPASLAKPAALPFEYWTLEVDPRHPVQLATGGVEIDPGEVPAVSPGPRSRAFFLVESQTLAITPLDVSLDKGRQGAGTAHVVYTQGRDDRWVGSLQLTSTTAPESDRIRIPTPAAPHYAESAGEAVRMFGDEGVLSLRVLSANGALQPIRVQWREEVSTNPVLSAVSLSLPGQSLHLDDERVDVRLLPGHVPIAVFGAASASGHIIDGLHIYALLIALLGVALARAARFPTWAVVILAVLLAGLYTVDGFPRTSLLVLLTGCAVLVRMPATALVATRQHGLLRGFVTFVWLAILLFTLAPAAVYMKDRIYSALHPWSYGSTYASEGSMAFGGMAARARVVEEAEEAPMDSLSAPIQKLEKRAGKGYADQQQQEAAAPRATEKTIRPVAFDSPPLPATPLSFSFGALLPGDTASATVLVAGPFLRGLWMFAECLGLGALLALLVMRARLWWRPA